MALNAPWSASTSTRDRDDAPRRRGGDRAAHRVVAREAGRHQVLRAVLHPLDRPAGAHRRRRRRTRSPGTPAPCCRSRRRRRARSPGSGARRARDPGVERAVGVRRLGRAHSVSLPLMRSNSATAPQVSIGAGCERGNTMSCSTTTSASANTRAVRPRRRPPSQNVVVVLPGLVVADDRRVGVQRPPRVHHHAQRLVLDLHQLERVAGRVAVPAITNATSWPWKRTLSVASTACVSPDRVGIQASPRASRSRPVMTASTLGCAQRRGRVDGHDAGVGVGAAQDRAVHHPRPLHVVDEQPAPADEPLVLLARHAPEADRPLGAGARGVCSDAISSPARPRPPCRLDRDLGGDVDRAAAAAPDAHAAGHVLRVHPGGQDVAAARRTRSRTSPLPRNTGRSGCSWTAVPPSTGTSPAWTSRIVRTGIGAAPA